MNRKSVTKSHNRNLAFNFVRGQLNMLPLGGRHFHPLPGVIPKPPALRVILYFINLSTNIALLYKKRFEKVTAIISPDYPLV